MNRIAPLLLLVATAATAQTTTPAPKSATATAKPAVHHTTGAATSAVKLPPGVPPVRGLMHTAFALRYQEIKIGTGAVAEPNKLYKVKYTGWLASDGKKFDSSEDHPNKEAIQFPQGRGRVIPGWDQGFEGMKIGGKRRLFIPYQLAYGAMGRPPVIPGKSDLIFDIELVDVTDMPAGGPGGPGGMPGGRPMPRPTAPAPAPGQSPATPAPGQPTSPQAPQTAPASPKPVDPTAPTVAPNSATPKATPAPSTPSTPPPTAQPDKPANPAQPNPSN